MQTAILTDQVLKKLIPNTEVVPKICLERLRFRDKAAFMALYKLYSPAIYGLISRNLDDKEKCDLAFEQTFIHAWNELDHYDIAKCSLFTWLSRLATKTWQNIST